MIVRRELVRMLAGLALGGGGVVMVGCEGGASDEGESGVDTAPPVLARPILRLWAENVLWMDRSANELPVAYVSMARRQVFVDRAYRDRVSWLLGAHISVSTALWRIPLPGDPRGEPISPGDERREFEERSIQDWDPALVPSLDDMRILVGVPMGVRVELECIPVGPAGAAREPAGSASAPQTETDRPMTGAWFSASPWTMQVASAAPGEPVREDFMVIGGGTRHRDRGCAEAGEAVQLVGWAIRG
jgi:hypothetical protein